MNFTRKTISHESRSDECDIVFSSEIQRGIPESENEFSLNLIADKKIKIDYSIFDNFVQSARQAIQEQVQNNSQRMRMKQTRSSK